MNRVEKLELVRLLEEKERRLKYNRLKHYKPQKKQIMFHNATEPDVCLGAGNQLGKTFSAAHDIAYHMTGLYPDWWTGDRYKKPPMFWIGGKTIEVIRDSMQKLLLGDWAKEDDLGSGAIPRALLLNVVNRMGIKGAVDSFVVRHASGGESKATFKSYDTGREKWQAATLDAVYFDEEPPADIYSEGRTRTNKGQLGNKTRLTFTPLLGMTDVVRQFYQNPKINQRLIQFTILEAEHYTEEEKQTIIDGYPEHEREARANGIPILGSGRIFITPENKIKEPHIDLIPNHWALLNGLDFGWDHPQAAAQIAWDRDEDVIHVIRGRRGSKLKPSDQYQGVKSWAKDIPTAWPHDGLQHDKGSGQALRAQYAAAGFNMLKDHATHEAGGNGVEAGITEMYDRFETGRLLIDETITDFFEEFRLYHRKDGKIVKLQDDLICAIRYAIMMKRFAVSATELASTQEINFNFTSDF